MSLIKFVRISRKRYNATVCLYDNFFVYVYKGATISQFWLPVCIRHGVGGVWQSNTQIFYRTKLDEYVFGGVKVIVGIGEYQS